MKTKLHILIIIYLLCLVYGCINKNIAIDVTVIDFDVLVEDVNCIQKTDRFRHE